ncbi:MAG: acyl-CoA dehydrogenase family protein [Planctomycetota bacterium]
MTTVSFALESTMMFWPGPPRRPRAWISASKAAAAKEWNTTRAWRTVDEALQIRGGRGYETEQSLKDRGEAPINIERLMRDSRINPIFEGSSEIMHLSAGPRGCGQALGGRRPGRPALELRRQGQGRAVQRRAVLRLVVSDPLDRLHPPAEGCRRLRQARELTCAAERASRKLARSVFHGMAWYQAKLATSSSSCSARWTLPWSHPLTAVATCAKRMREIGDPNAKSAERIADLFARGAKRNIKQWFKDITTTTRSPRRRQGAAHRRLRLDGEGTAGILFSVEELRPPTVSELIAR